MFVVAGVTGKTGSVVAGALLDARRPVRVLVRQAEKGEPWRARGAEVAVGALEDAGAVERALRGASAAFVLLPPDFHAGDPLAAARARADALATAVERSGLPHGVLLSSHAAHLDDGTGIIRTLRYAEQRLARTPAKWTFLRAPYFIENFAPLLDAAARDGVLPSFIRPDLAMPMAGTRDIGLEAARALMQGPPAVKVDVVELFGPREYSPRDVARALASVLGREVAAVAAPEDAIVPTFIGMGASAGLAEQYRLLNRGINDGTVAPEGGRARQVRGSLGLEAVLGAVLGRS